MGYRYQLNYCLLGGMNGVDGGMRDAKKLVKGGEEALTSVKLGGGLRAVQVGT